jgi:hypothetical protein
MEITVKDMLKALAGWPEDALMGAFFSSEDGYTGYIITGIDDPDESGLCRVFLSPEVSWEG